MAARNGLTNLDVICRQIHIILLFTIVTQIDNGFSQDVGLLGCGGFVKSQVDINFSLIEVKLFSKQGQLKYQTDCAPNNGYFFIPLDDKGEFVLKVEPPAGWTFDPPSFELHIDGTNDKCSKSEDINFFFKGFTISGQVVSKGFDNGPSGVVIDLVEKTGFEILSTSSGLGGEFSFSRIFPGQYDIKVKHASWTFENSVVSVAVSSDNVVVGVDRLMISAYDVTGSVVSERVPIQGVSFILLSDTVKDVEGCIMGPPPGYISESKMVLLCHVLSGEDGLFVFSSLPTANYVLVPFYRGEQIQFDVLPSTLDFAVVQDSVTLPVTFIVSGFSVIGRVLGSHNGSPLAGAKIFLDKKEVALTQADGTYQLDNMVVGSYELIAEKSNLHFEPVAVRVTPSTPQLPDMYPSRFSVCGSVSIQIYPDGVRSTLSRHFKVFNNVTGDEIGETTADKDGLFCVNLAPGSYSLLPVVSELEEAAGLKLVPDILMINVKNQPVMGSVFNQFLAVLTGSVICMDKCTGLSVSLTSASRADNRQMHRLQSDQLRATFEFIQLVPGKYKVAVVQDDWCWNERNIDVEIKDQDVDVDFHQSGFMLKCTISHSIELTFSQEGGDENVGSFNLTQGVNRFCLAKPGVYKLTPISCLEFEETVYTYDTSSPHVLVLNAVRYRVEGTVTSDTETQDIILHIKSNTKSETIDVRPLPVIPQNPRLTTPPNNNTEVKVTPTHDPPFVYEFSHWAQEGETITVTLSSSELLFYPSVFEYTITPVGCPGHVMDFKARKGLFIEGSISPSLEGVTVRIKPTSEKSLDNAVVVVTGESGQYRIGPLHGDSEFTITAEREGYHIVPEPGRHGHFNSFKLGEIIVKVRDEIGQPLTGVLLSLSGGEYRSNNITHPDGSMSFLGLGPGQYFLRPMMKEFNFNPPSKMISVFEGGTIQVDISGKRVAFSCYGSVTSLNGEPEGQVKVEAVGVGDCFGEYEECVTDHEGLYRVKALRPRCEYHVQVMLGDVSGNSHIERTGPKYRSIIMPEDDVYNMNMIVFRKSHQFDISGYIITDSEFLPTLKVLLYDESNMDSPLFTQPLGHSSFFHFPAEQKDNTNYLLKLETSLSKNSYDFVQPERSFSAIGHSKHVTLDFKPIRHNHDHDVISSSFLTLPLTVIVIILGLNYSKLVPLFTELTVKLKSTMKQTNDRPLEETAVKHKKKAKVRRT